jgi:hypothetical protein
MSVNTTVRQFAGAATAVIPTQTPTTSTKFGRKAFVLEMLNYTEPGQDGEPLQPKDDSEFSIIPINEDFTN